VAEKQLEKWSEEDRKWLELLPVAEREVVLLLAAHLHAAPAEPPPDE
jgi:hypothetical protein